MSISTDHVVTTAELADLHRVKPFTIREWHRRKLITPAYRVGRLMRWDPEQVREQLARATAEGRA